MTVPSALLQCHLSKVYANATSPRATSSAAFPPSRLSSAWLPRPPVFPRTRRHGGAGWLELKMRLGLLPAC
jgi:hypothetical protein